MTIPKKEFHNLLDQLRQLAPKRPLTYGESLQIARLQADRLRQWAEADNPDINLIWLISQHAIPVQFVPSHKLDEESGLTTDLITGQLEMYINDNEPHLRQRFSLLHEFKHVIDFYDADVLHAKLGCGNEEAKGRMIEWACDEFAGNVLMPTILVKRLWFKVQDLPTMANLFHVSVEAMATRLGKLGLLGEVKPKSRHYFRRPLITANV
jgi:Zn-dependent peptidase ImmA (M78 family)